jgi:hypothetical protein
VSLGLDNDGNYISSIGSNGMGVGFEDIYNGQAGTYTRPDVDSAEWTRQ